MSNKGKKVQGKIMLQENEQELEQEQLENITGGGATLTKLKGKVQDPYEYVSDSSGSSSPTGSYEVLPGTPASSPETRSVRDMKKKIVNFIDKK